MDLNFGPKGILQIDNARIIFRNFAGLGDKFNREGDRNFALVIPNTEIAEALMEDKNKYGVPWNVIVKDAKEDGADPYMHMKVKVKYKNGRGPKITLISGNAENNITEETVGELDRIDIDHVDLDIRPYDDEINGKPFRAAYLQSMDVFQRVDRFEARRAARRSEDDELPFN